MISITRHIEYLITCHDCVIVPGWGAFIANSSPARYVDEGEGKGILFPPRRTLSFNPGITHNDGLLVTSLMRRDGLSYDTALQEIERQVGEMRRQVDSEGEVTLPNIGSFKFNSEAAAPLFTPSPDSLANAPFFGFPKLRLLALPAATPADMEGETVVDTPEDTPSEACTTQKTFKRFILPAPVIRAVRVAAVAALSFGFGYVLYLSTKATVDTSSGNLAFVDPSAALPKVSGTNPVKVSEYIPRTSQDTELYIAIPPRDIEEVPIDVLSQSEPTVGKPETPRTDGNVATVNTTPTPNYYLIVASLESRNRAERYLESAGDPTLRILEEDGRYRVYAATGTSIEEAMQRKKDPSFSTAHPDAWVYRRR